MSSDKEEKTNAFLFPEIDPENVPVRSAYTYMLLCADGTLYTGWTNDLKKRLAAHQSGRGSRYTSVRRPVRLCYVEGYETRHDAMAREVKIKQLSREEKCQLIRTAQENSTTCGN